MICSLTITGTNGATFVGTGWFAGPHTLITAGHCVYDAALGGWAREITVRPGRDGANEPFTALRCKRFSTTDRWRTLRDPDFDYGALHLDKATAEPISTQTGWFSTAVMTDAALANQRVNVSGYPLDKGAASGAQGSEQWFHAKQIITVLPLRVYYDVDTAAGQSGSPVWLETPAGRRVIGIHAYGVGGSTHLGIVANSAPRITKEVLAVLRTWISKV
ncbi:MAG: trypsin-like peptidase domain-containing protein [Polyangiaceae bacterium]